MKKSLFLLFFLVSVVATAANKRYSFKGKLGADINFRIDLEEEDYTNVVMGQMTYYRKNGKTSKIKVFGTSTKTVIFDDDYKELYLNEYNGTKICGDIHMLITADGIFDNGTWSFNDKVLTMENVEKISNSPSMMLPTRNLDEAQGVYEYSIPTGNAQMPEYGGQLQLYVQGKNFAYSFSVATPNIAKVNARTSEFFRNCFYFYAGDVQYRMLSYDGVIYISRNNTHKGQNEAFGKGADIEGFYIATGKEPEGEITHAFDAELEFSKKNLPCTVFELNDVWMDAIGGETTFPDEMIAKDIDGDGKNEIIARYLPNRTEHYEVGGKRTAIFADNGGKLVLVAKAEGDSEELSVAKDYVIKSVKSTSGSRTTTYYYRLSSSSVNCTATMTEAEINSYTINGNTVKEKDLKKQIKVKKPAKVLELDGWIVIPGNQYRNEHAARG